MDVTGDRGKVLCCKEQYCIGTWNVGSISSVQFSRSVVSTSLRPHESQHARPPCPSPTPRVYPNPCPSSRWCHHPFILSGVISPLISNSILGTYWPGEFIFQCPIFLPFHTVHGVLKVRILQWFAIPFSSGPHSVKNKTGSWLWLRSWDLYCEIQT